MKKVYRKPDLWYESFQLSQSIAAGCEGIANYAENMCSVTVEYGNGSKINIFNIADVCDYSSPGGDDQVCYHAPTEYNNVFSS